LTLASHKDINVFTDLEKVLDFVLLQVQQNSPDLEFLGYLLEKLPTLTMCKANQLSFEDLKCPLVAKIEKLFMENGQLYKTFHESISNKVLDD
jgi:hypothetical protein